MQMTFPNVIHAEKSDQCVTLQLNVSADLDAFKGHFDKAPIVPGVVQLYWTLHFCSLYLRDIPATSIDQIEALKFQHVIQPDTRVELSMEEKNGKLNFAFSSESGRHSSGKIVLL
jgi:3-hydroxymyristoyl/3-hydroxydecanoyl-(acyl carrier protein) dehydratase